MRQRECAIWASADLSLYLSDEEAQIASALQPQATIGAIVPYCFDRFSQQRSAQPGREIIFVAGFGHPPRVIRYKIHAVENWMNVSAA